MPLRASQQRRLITLTAFNVYMVSSLLFKSMLAHEQPAHEQTRTDLILFALINSTNAAELLLRGVSNFSTGIASVMRLLSAWRSAMRLFILISNDFILFAPFLE